MTSSPEWQGMASLSLLLLPERLFAFTNPGFTRGSPLSARPMVGALILRMFSRTSGATVATNAAYSSTHRAMSALR